MTRVANLPQPSTLEGIIQQCDDDSHNWFPRKADDLPFMALALCGEAGEVANQVKKVARGSHTLQDQKAKIEEEAIDTFIYLMDIFALLGTDVVKEYHVKRAYNAERFGRGTS